MTIDQPPIVRSAGSKQRDERGGHSGKCVEHELWDECTEDALDLCPSVKPGSLARPLDAALDEEAEETLDVAVDVHLEDSAEAAVEASASNFGEDKAASFRLSSSSWMGEGMAQ